MKKATRAIIAVLALALLITTILSNCGRHPSSSEKDAPVLTNAPVSPADSAGSFETLAKSGRQDGERFEEVIILEGMEETVRYEHLRNADIGIEMDYDYESFVRRTEPGRECFISIYDDPQNPENYLEVTCRPGDAESVAASVSQVLSQEYDLLSGPRELDRAGSCIWIEASVIKGRDEMAELLQSVYIIPAADGCRVATAHYNIENAEGFGRRFSYIVNTIAVIDRNGESTLSDEQALSAIRRYCTISDPDLENIVNAGEYPVYWEIASGNEQQVVVLFRSYTGAQIRYYIDRSSGDTYVTEYVPGITPEEERTEERFNVKDFL